MVDEAGAEVKPPGLPGPRVPDQDEAQPDGAIDVPGVEVPRQGDEGALRHPPHLLKTLSSDRVRQEGEMARQQAGLIPSSQGQGLGPGLGLSQKQEQQHQSMPAANRHETFPWRKGGHGQKIGNGVPLSDTLPWYKGTNRSG